MEKDNTGITITRLVLTSALIWSSGFLIFVIIEGILRLLRGSTPWLFMMLGTLFLYIVCGIGMGVVFGFTLGFLRKLFNPLRQKTEAIALVMSCCMGFLVFLFAGIFVNQWFLTHYAHPSTVSASLTLGVFSLFSSVAFYRVLTRWIPKRRLFSSYLAFSITLYAFMIVGLYINEHVLSGSFFSMDVTRVIVNIGVVMGSFVLYFLTYSMFTFISRKVGTTGNPRNLKLVIALFSILLLGGGALYSVLFSLTQEQLVEPGEGSGNKPNIILITMDTTRSDHLSCYGYHKNTTPNLDALAHEGVIFTNAYATSPWTLPSHASIFTGMYSVSAVKKK